MNKIYIYYIYLLVFMFLSCAEDNDDNLSPTSISDINDFVYRGMNLFYVYKDDVFTEANMNIGFTTNLDYINYLNSFSNPEALFNSLIYKPDNSSNCEPRDPNSIDRYSLIVSDFLALEAQLQGTRLSNGMAFGLVVSPNNTDTVFGYVRYVSPGTDAETKGVQRGMIFNAVDNIPLTCSNFGNLLFGSNTYTINLANYNDNGTPNDNTDDTIVSTNNTITLTRQEFTEDPILESKIITEGAHKIGYLMYNGFRSSANNMAALNAVFGHFKSENVTDLVLDLRYNGGGSVNTAIWLSSMITGQFTGDIMFTEKWNTDFQQAFEAENPETLVNRFTNEIVVNNNGSTFQQSINSLNLSRVYILTSRSSASASELVINSLSPKITVKQIGTRTNGKPQASTTIYDSENFRRDNANVNHNYALQPLIYEAVNSSGFSNYYNGLEPTTFLAENYSNLGVLGDVNEPLLAEAIAQITGNANRHQNATEKSNIFFEEIANDTFNTPLLNEMFDVILNNTVKK